MAVYIQRTTDRILTIPGIGVEIVQRAPLEALAWAVVFNGTTTNINCGSGASLDNLHDGAMTAEAWIKADGAGGAGNGRFFDKTATHTAGWTFLVGATWKLQAYVLCATTTSYSFAPTDLTVLDSLWHHVAMTWDDATYNYPKMWLDGTEVSYAVTRNRSGAVISDAGADLHIGNRNDSARAFDGAIGCCRLSKVVRYTTTFTPFARTSPPAIDGNTTEQWNMDEGTGATAAAQVNSPANDGTISNGSWVRE